MVAVAWVGEALWRVRYMITGTWYWSACEALLGGWVKKGWLKC
jgi:hypothetical protein